MRNPLVLAKKKSQLTERLALNFSQIHPVISRADLSIQLRHGWILWGLPGRRGCVHVCKVGALLQCVFQLGLSWFAHPEPGPPWEPNRGNGDLSENYPRKHPPEPNRSSDVDRGETFGRRQIKKWVLWLSLPPGTRRPPRLGSPSLLQGGVKLPRSSCSTAAGYTSHMKETPNLCEISSGLTAVAWARLSVSRIRGHWRGKRQDRQLGAVISPAA